MTVITSKLLSPTGTALAGERVTARLAGVRLLADDTGSIVGDAATTTDNTGTWTLNLTPTSHLDDPAAHYVIREAGAEYTITVPATGGPYQIAAVLISPPTPTGVTIGASQADLAAAIAAHVAAADPHPTYLTQTEGDARYAQLAAWTDYTLISAFAAGMGQTADQTMDQGGIRAEPGGILRLRGALDATGVIAAGTTAFTLPAGLRPGKSRRVLCRLGSAAVRLLVNPDGTCQLSAATSAGAQLLLDGITIDQ